MTCLRTSLIASALPLLLGSAALAQGSFASSTSRTVDGVTTTTERSGTFSGQPPVDIQERIDRARDRALRGIDRTIVIDRDRSTIRSFDRSITIER